MVQGADPKMSQADPSLVNQAQQTLGDMLALYQKQTGQPHPLVAATQAANASAQGGGVTAPVTIPGTSRPTPRRTRSRGRWGRTVPRRSTLED